MALQVREVDRPEWDGPVVEIREDGEPLGQVFRDGDDLLVEWFVDDEGAGPVLEIAEVIRVLEVAAAILAPEPPGAFTAQPEDEDPIEVLADEFDHRATRRGSEDEGFFAVRVAVAIAQRCGDLGVAIARLEGVKAVTADPVPVPGFLAEIAPAHRGEPWPTFVAACNVQADAVLGRWAREPDLLVAIEIEDSAGEVYVL